MQDDDLTAVCKGHGDMRIVRCRDKGYLIRSRIHSNDIASEVAAAADIRVLAI